MTDDTGCTGLAHRLWWGAYDLLGHVPAALHRGPVGIFTEWLFDHAAATCDFGPDDSIPPASDTNSADIPA